MINSVEMGGDIERKEIYIRKFNDQIESCIDSIEGETSLNINDNSVINNTFL